MPKIPRPAQSSDRHNPLAEEYSGAQSFKTKAPKKRSRKDEEDEDVVVGTKASRKILKIGQELVEEDEKERRLLRAEGVTVPNPAFSFESRLPHDVDSEEETEKYDGEGEEAWGEEEETFEVEVHLIAHANVAQYTDIGRRKSTPTTSIRLTSSYLPPSTTRYCGQARNR